MNSFSNFGSTAQKLSQGPLGIIALFIVLVYGFATLDLTLGANLTRGQQWTFVIFLVAFPLIVLCVFAWLVMKYHRNLYHPKDFPESVLGHVFLGLPERTILPVPASNEVITARHMALTSSCWRAPHLDERFQTRAYRFDVIVVATEEVLNTISEVEYELPEAWGEFGDRKRTIRTRDRQSSFKLKNVTFNSNLPVTADVRLKDKRGSVQLSTFVRVAEIGPRL